MGAGDHHSQQSTQVVHVRALPSCRIAWVRQRFMQLVQPTHRRRTRTNVPTCFASAIMVLRRNSIVISVPAGDEMMEKWSDCLSCWAGHSLRAHRPVSWSCGPPSCMAREISKIHGPQSHSLARAVRIHLHRQLAAQAVDDQVRLGLVAAMEAPASSPPNRFTLRSLGGYVSRRGEILDCRQVSFNTGSNAISSGILEARHYKYATGDIQRLIMQQANLSLLRLFDGSPAGSHRTNSTHLTSKVRRCE